MGKITDIIERRRWVERTRVVFPRGVEVTLKEGYTWRDLTMVRVFDGPVEAERGSVQANVIRPPFLYVSAAYRDGWLYLRRSDGADLEKVVQVASYREAVKLVTERVGITCSSV